LATTSEAVGKDGTTHRTTITRSLTDGAKTMNQRIEMVLADGTTHRATRVFRRQ